MKTVRQIRTTSSQRIPLPELVNGRLQIYFTTPQSPHLFHFKKSPMSEELKISGPMEVRHVLHVDRNLNWEFNEQTDASAAFVKKRDIGKGGFGTVCELEHVESGTCFAGKIISPDAMSRSSRESLMHEINLLREIRSPFTISYFGSVLYQNSVMIMMEYCERGSLRDVMDFLKVKLTEPQIKIVMRDLLMAISVLHSRYKIIHRDVKAANILVGKDGRLKVTDFGVSKKFDVGKTVNTCSIMGTPYWMAPEVVYGNKYSYPADVWSIGATAVELLEGMPPYGEYPVMRAICEIGQKGFPGFRPGTVVSDEFREFVEMCMIKDPALRAKPEQLLAHRFLADVDSLDRMEVLGPLLTKDIDFEKLLRAGEEEEEEEEEEEDDNDDLMKAFKARTVRVASFRTEAGTPPCMHNDRMEEPAPVCAAVEETKPVVKETKPVVKEAKPAVKETKPVMKAEDAGMSFQWVRDPRAAGAIVVALLVLVKVLGFKGVAALVTLIAALAYAARLQRE